MNTEPLLAELGDYLESQLAGNPPGAPSLPPTPSLIRRLFKRQLALNPAAAQFLTRAGLQSTPVHALADIPAVPVAAFKELELTTVPPSERVTVFHSSGTTGQKHSRHFHSPATLRIYRQASTAWFARRVLGDIFATVQDMISLTPSPPAAPHSSLVFMVGALMERFGTANSRFTGAAAEEGWRVDPAIALKALQAAQQAERPVIVFGTAFNFVHLLDALGAARERVELPPGSRILETGGYKGRSRSVPKPELHARLAEQLGVSREDVVSEYGMSELSSQAYDVDRSNARAGRRTGVDSADPRRFQFPPWCQALVVSPETGRLLPHGYPGLLRIVDLANVASVLAIQTQDLAVMWDDGFELLGRSPHAEPRGCSLLPVAVDNV